MYFVLVIIKNKYYFFSETVITEYDQLCLNIHQVQKYEQKIIKNTKHNRNRNHFMKITYLHHDQ